MKESINLHYQEGGSDKIYNVELIETTVGKYHVWFEYGRRGSALTSGSKTVSPTSYESAKKIYDKLVREKMSKGYKVLGSDANISAQSSEKVFSGVAPQLLNDISGQDIEPYLTSEAWIMQEKFDGQRRLILTVDSVLCGTNRKGDIIQLSFELRRALSPHLTSDVILDGEDLGLKGFIVFDILSPTLRNLSYELRLKSLEALVRKINNPLIGFAGMNTKESIKRNLMQDLIKFKAEGVVFKRRDAPYSPGRPASGGDQLKYKFYATATAKVIGHHPSKASVELGMYDDLKHYYIRDTPPVSVGNVAIPVNKERPSIGSFVEVRYLYWYASGSLYQPVYIGERTDVDEFDCRLSRLKPKKSDGDTEN